MYMQMQYTELLRTSKRFDQSRLNLRFKSMDRLSFFKKNIKFYFFKSDHAPLNRAFAI